MYTWSVVFTRKNGDYDTATVKANTEIGAKKAACRLWHMPNSYTHPSIKAAIKRHADGSPV